MCEGEDPFCLSSSSIPLGSLFWGIFISRSAGKWAPLPPPLSRSRFVMSFSMEGLSKNTQSVSNDSGGGVVVVVA